jgi:hypothetical protein
MLLVPFTAMMVKKTGVKDVTDNAGTTANAIVNNVANNINKCGDGWQISNHLNAYNGSATGVEVLYGSSLQARRLLRSYLLQLRKH